MSKVFNNSAEERVAKALYDAKHSDGDILQCALKLNSIKSDILSNKIVLNELMDSDDCKNYWETISNCLDELDRTLSVINPVLTKLLT